MAVSGGVDIPLVGRGTLPLGIVSISYPREQWYAVIQNPDGEGIRFERIMGVALINDGVKPRFVGVSPTLRPYDPDDPNILHYMHEQDVARWMTRQRELAAEQKKAELEQQKIEAAEQRRLRKAEKRLEQSSQKEESEDQATAAAAGG